MKGKHNSLCVGIDLGTTNSVIATCSVENGMINTPVSRIDRCKDIGNRDNRRIESSELLPSCVYYQDMKDGNYDPIVGDYAKTMSFTQPYAVSRSIKKQMGQPKVNIDGWKKEYKDLTPEDVASRIIRHLIASLEEYYNEKIEDVIITIPASFNSAQSEATLRAAERAGIDISLENGEILLPEPEAVIYNVLNQIQNGKINSTIDFSSNKRVMVFDIGGGTLDITLHDICRRKGNLNDFDFKPLATNRFSTIAGDAFDDIIAELLYEKYISYYERQSPDIAKRIRDDYSTVMINLVNHAEELKLRINNKYKDRMKRGNMLLEDEEFASGGYMPNGYTSEDTVTLREFEECLSPLLGWDYKYDDYKRFDEIIDDQNIIFPIIDVLNKATEKLKEDEIKVDAVIMNGGMSRLYLIDKRLTEFFGFKPITVIDPDKSVAQGAAVYHYYIHQDDSIKTSNMAYMNQTSEHMDSSPASKPSFRDVTPIKQVASIRAVSSGVLNESIYLGLKGGGTCLLAGIGQDIPFASDVIPGFTIAPRQKIIRIPIKQQTKDGKFQTIAVGNISFKRAMMVETPVSIRFFLRRGNILAIEAWTSSDSSGENVIESGAVTLSIGDIDRNRITRRHGQAMNPPSGTNLVIANELSAFKSHIDKLKRSRNRNDRRHATERLAQMKRAILNCGNPEEFADRMLAMLRQDRSSLMTMYLLPIARKLSVYWSEKQLADLSKICLSVLSMDLLGGWIAEGKDIAANSEAIKTVGACGITSDCEKLEKLCENIKYRSPLLYAFGRCGSNHEWIYQEFLNDINRSRPIQDSLRAVGLSIYQSRGKTLNIDIQKLTEDVCRLINMGAGALHKNELSIAIVTHAMLICWDDADTNGEEKYPICDISTVYGPEAYTYTQKSRLFAEKLIGRGELTEEDEAFLLGVLTDDVL